MMQQRWVRYLNVGLASLVVTFGFWIVWSDLSFIVGSDRGATLIGTVAIALAAMVMLLGRAGTIGEIWAWATVLLGIESLAWPIAVMIQVWLSTPEPTEAQMGRIFIAVLFGLFSSIFWLTFGYGLFKWTRRKVQDVRGGGR